MNQQSRSRRCLTPFMLVFLLPMLAIGSLGVRASAAAQDAPVTINLWFFEGEEQLLPALEQAFEAANPNINLEITQIPEDQYVVKIDTALAAGSPPDVGFLYEPTLGESRPGTAARRRRSTAHEIDLKDFNQSVMQGLCTIDGKVYCLGSYTGAVVLLYNKAMFDAAGIEYPSASEPMTIDQYAEIAQKLTAPSDDLPQYVWGASAEAPYWWMDRSTMFSADGRTTAGLINDDATKHTYEVLGNMIAQGWSPGASVHAVAWHPGSEDLLPARQAGHGHRRLLAGLRPGRGRHRLRRRHAAS